MSLPGFFQIMKADAQEKTIYLRATDERKDLQNQIMDYDGSKPFFEAWSMEFATSTNGKSYGNVRLQHNMTAPIGKVSEPLQFDDEAKTIDMVVKVVDDVAWQLVEEGVLTGGSIGGRPVRKWYDANANAQRYIVDPFELSLVDKPCNPNSKFLLIKADGTNEECSFNVTVKENNMEKLDVIKTVLGGEIQKVFNGTDDEKRERIYGALNEAIKVPYKLANGDNDLWFWIRDVYADHVIISGNLDGDNDNDLYDAKYTISDDGVVAITSELTQVRAEYVPATDETKAPEEPPITKADGEEPKTEEPKEEPKKEVVEKVEGEPAKEEPAKEPEVKVEEPKTEEIKKADGEEPKTEETVKEEPKTDEVKEEPKQEEIKKADGEPPKEEKPKKEEVKEEPAKEEPKKETPVEEPKKEEVQKTDRDEILKSITAEEIIGMINPDNMEDVIMKVGAKYSKDNLATLQKVHHIISEMGGACTCEKCSSVYKSSEDAIEKADGVSTEDRIGALEKTVTDLSTQNSNLILKVQALEATPDDSNAPKAYAINDKTITGMENGNIQKADGVKPTISEVWEQIQQNPVRRV